MYHTAQIKKDPTNSQPLAGWQQYDWVSQGESGEVWQKLQQGFAMIMFVGLLPVFTLLYVAVKATSTGPFIYRQQRYGLRGELFTAFKIRTMRVGADRSDARARNVVEDDPMITPIGRILRDLKLDELPQLWNVVRGEMSLVGPRPIAQQLQKELEGKIPGFARRLSVRPGLTSLAQVCLYQNGTDVVDDWQTRFEAELEYLYHRSWRYDLLIIGLTGLFLVKKLARKIPRALFLLPALVLLLTACSERLSTHTFTRADTAFEKPVPTFGTRQELAVAVVEPVSIPVEGGDWQDPEYRLGAGDRLAINIFGEVGLDNLSVSVDGAGYIQVPYLERIAVAGKTVGELQLILKEGFSKQFRSPWVVVEMREYRSRPVYLLGEFNNPGVIYLDGPTNLLQAMSLGRGMSGLAHLRGARLWRGDNIAAVDLHALLVEGRSEHNVLLLPGDTIFVPSRADKKAYVLGAVARAGAVPFANEPMTLLKALTQVGGAVKSAALLSQVRVIRVHSAVQGQLILVNVKDMLKGKAPDLELMPDDIVYVPDNMLESWNQVVRAVAPTLQLAGGALQPFVQVKFLKGD